MTALELSACAQSDQQFRLTTGVRSSGPSVKTLASVAGLGDDAGGGAAVAKQRSAPFRVISRGQPSVAPRGRWSPSQLPRRLPTAWSARGASGMRGAMPGTRARSRPSVAGRGRLRESFDDCLGVQIWRADPAEVSVEAVDGRFGEGTVQRSDAIHGRGLVR